jgi:hypothetical protein
MPWPARVRVVDQRGRRQARYVVASIEKTLGALPVVADFCGRLDVARIIDRACPVRTSVTGR